MVGAAIGAVGAIGGSLIGAIGANDAADTQASAANNATATQLGMFNMMRKDLSLYRDAGMKALPAVNKLLGISIGGADLPAEAKMMRTLQGIPGFQFTQQQGNKALANQLASGGLQASGAAIKAAQAYNTGLASQNYNSYLQNLINMAQIGENAAAQTGVAGLRTGEGVTNNLIGAGNAQAGATIAGYNAIGGGLGQLGMYAMMNKDDVNRFFGVNSNTYNFPDDPLTGYLGPFSYQP